MPIRFRCPSCNAKIKVPDGSEGRKVKCPRCGLAQEVRNDPNETATPESTDTPQVLENLAPPAAAGASKALRAAPTPEPATEPEPESSDDDNPLAALAAAAGTDEPAAPAVAAPTPPPTPKPVAVAPPAPKPKPAAPTPPPTPPAPPAAIEAIESESADDLDPAAALAAALGGSDESAAEAVAAPKPAVAARAVAPKPIPLSSTPAAASAPAPAAVRPTPAVKPTPQPGPAPVREPEPEPEPAAKQEEPAFTIDEQPAVTVPVVTPALETAAPTPSHSISRTVIRIPAYTGLSAASWALRILAVLALAGGAKMFMMARETSMAYGLLAGLFGMWMAGVAWALGEAAGAFRDIARNSFRR